MNDQTNITFATELTIAWLANPNTRVDADAVPAFLASMHDAVSGLGSAAAAAAPDTTSDAVEHTPAVTVRKSLADPEYIVSMIDGRKYRSLKRHLGTHGLTPDEYRQRYGLKADYPMTAPAYSKARSEVAKALGLGRKPRQKIEKAVEPKQPASKVRKRKSVSEAKAAAKAHLGGSR